MEVSWGLLKEWERISFLKEYCVTCFPFDELLKNLPEDARASYISNIESKIENNYEDNKNEIDVEVGELVKRFIWRHKTIEEKYDLLMEANATLKYEELSIYHFERQIFASTLERKVMK